MNPPQWLPGVYPAAEDDGGGWWLILFASACTAVEVIDWPRTLHMQLEPRVGPGGILGVARDAYFSL